MADAKTASKRATEAAAAAAEGEETTSGALSEPSGSSDSGNGGAAPAAPPHKKRKRPSDRKFPTGLQRAFECMRSQGRLLAVENAACCSTCAHAECAELLAGDDEAVGYVFYHSQDLEAAAGSGVLYLGHAARDGMPDRVPALVAVDTLRELGLEVEWDGTMATRVKVLIPEGPERDYFRRRLQEEEDEYGMY